MAIALGEQSDATCSAGSPKVVCVAGTSSGVGKTSLAVGLMAAFRRRGLKVQAFKVGPDFLDPMHHEAATGRNSINLDGWMLSHQQNLACFHRHAAGTDICVIEGVMGLFDGRDGKTEDGSTAQMAKWLGAPVVLVLDCWALARSAAAMVKGYQEFDAGLRIGGLLLNKVGGKAHTQWLLEALQAAGVQARVLGGISKDDTVTVKERYLGLHMPGESSLPQDYLARLADLIERDVDLEAVLALAASARVPPPPDPTPSAGLALPVGPRVRVGVARDAAFCFYYNENLALLEGAGAEVVLFSPLADPLPANLSGLYFGGGYPEKHAADLASNRALTTAVRAFAEAGGVVYGECGGLLYLSQSIQPLGEPPASMVGVFPFRTAMTVKGMKMGYVEVEVQDACPLFPAGTRARGHVFHFSEILQERVVGGFGAAATSGDGWSAGYQATMQTPNAAPVPEGYTTRNALASYVHLHFGSAPELAPALVARCRTVDVAAVNVAASLAAAGAETGSSSRSASPEPGYARTSGMVPAWSVPNLASPSLLGAAAPRVQRQLRHGERSRSADGSVEDGLAVRQARTADCTPYGSPPVGLGLSSQRRLSPERSASCDVGLMRGHSHSAALANGGAHSQVSSANHSPLLRRGFTSSSSLQQQGDLPPAKPACGVYSKGSTRSLASSPASTLPLNPSSDALHRSQPGSPLCSRSPQNTCAGSDALAGQPHLGSHLHSASESALYQPGHQGQRSSLHLPPGYVVPPLPGHAGGLHRAQSSQVPSGHAAYAQANGAQQAGYWPEADWPASLRQSEDGGLLHASSSASRDLGSQASTSGRSDGYGGGAPSWLRAGHGWGQAWPRSASAPASRQVSWSSGLAPREAIVSLLPSGTEICFALGLGGRLVAVSDLCDYPPEADSRPKASRSRIDCSKLSSADIEAKMQECKRSGQSPFIVDEALLARLAPGLVLTQSSCQSCDADVDNVAAALERAGLLAGHPPPTRLLCLAPRSLADVLDSILQVGHAAGVGADATRLVDRLRGRLRAVAGEVARAATRPRVLSLEGLQPLCLGGQWLPEVKALAGGRDDWQEPGDPPTRITWDQVREYAPEVLVLSPCSASPARALAEAAELAGLPGWWALPAVRTGRVFIADHAFFSRPGPRLVEGVEVLARILHPQLATRRAPPGAVLKLSLQGGQRCRQRLLANYFAPYT